MATSTLIVARRREDAVLQVEATVIEAGIRDVWVWVSGPRDQPEAVETARVAALMRRQSWPSDFRLVDNLVNFGVAGALLDVCPHCHQISFRPEGALRACLNPCSTRRATRLTQTGLSPAGAVTRIGLKMSRRMTETCWGTHGDSNSVRGRSQSP
jgi:hypothetical protein